MRSLEAYARLKSFKVFRTVDAATLLKTNIDACQKILSRLTVSQLLVKLCRGLWTWPGTDPTLLPEYLTAPSPSYVSLQTALYLHGLISQIPQVIYAVTLGRTRRIATPLATFSFHHIPPQFFFGFTPQEGIKLASPEKALLDVLYLSPAKSRLFIALPELTLPNRFDQKQVKAMIKKIPSLQRRTLVSKRLAKLVIHRVIPTS